MSCDLNSIELIEGLCPPVARIKFVAIRDDQTGRLRPLTDEERLARAASWGYRQAVKDHLDCEDREAPDGDVIVFDNVIAFDNATGYTINPEKVDP